MCSVVCDSLWPHGLQLSGLLCPWISPGKNTGVGCHFLPQGVFATQGLNPCLLHLLDCKKILYLLSHWSFPVPGRYTSTLVIYLKVSSIELSKGVAREKHRRKIQTKIKPYRITIKVRRVRDWKLRPLWIHCFSPSVANCFPGVSTLCFEGLGAFPLTLERNLRCESE